MDTPKRPWLRAAIVVAAAYVVVGVAFSALDDSADASVEFLWRLGAWVASAAVAAVHIGYEQYRLGSSPRTTALHAAGAVALGAFGLAVAANIHSLFVPTPHHRALLIALFAWPVITALPAFVGAIVVAALLNRFSRRG